MDAFAKILPLGKTWAGQAIASGDWAKTADLEGLVAFFGHDGSMLSSGLVESASANRVKAVLVRNSSGSALSPGQAVLWDANYIGRRVSGYAASGIQSRFAGVVDPSLKSDVAAGDLFWLIVGGPTKIKTVASSLSAISAGDLVSIGDSSGRINKASTVPADAAAALTLALSMVGIAMEARGTGDTNKLTSVMLYPTF